jgi:hypothetical protein
MAIGSWRAASKAQLASAPPVGFCMDSPGSHGLFGPASRCWVELHLNSIRHLAGVGFSFLGLVFSTVWFPGLFAASLALTAALMQQVCPRGDIEALPAGRLQYFCCLFGLVLIFD